MEAEPPDMSFTWALAPPSDQGHTSHDEGGVINGDPTHVLHYPDLIDLTPNHPLRGQKHRKEHERIRHNHFSKGGRLLSHKHDPSHPSSSLLTIVPDKDAMDIVCYAKNKVGHTKVPCSYSISVIGKFV